MRPPRAEETPINPVIFGGTTLEYLKSRFAEGDSLVANDRRVLTLDNNPAVAAGEAIYIVTSNRSNWGQTPVVVELSNQRGRFGRIKNLGWIVGTIEKEDVRSLYQLDTVLITDHFAIRDPYRDWREIFETNGKRLDLKDLFGQV